MTNSASGSTSGSANDHANNAEHYHAIVIGAGQGGGPLAGALATAGQRVALIERKYVGGTCVNYGCTPTKTMVASAAVAHFARRAANYGVRVGSVSVDMTRVRERKQEIVEEFRSGSRESLEKKDGLELLRGEARFTGDRTIRVSLEDGGSQTLQADKVFINTGQSPVVPELDGLDSVPYLDSTSIMELGDVPEHLLILGGGYIGVEFSQMFRRFGSEVTIVQRADRLLTREDKDVTDEVVSILRDDGITVLLETDAVRVAGEEGRLELTVKGSEGEKTLRGSHLLVAVGRQTNADSLNLGAAGVETDERGNIRVDERLETSTDGIYALGDVKGGPAFTHISYDDFRILKANLLHDGNRTTKDRPIPYTVFIDPQLARVGLSESQAKEAGHDIKVAKMPMKSAARAIETGRTRGFMKAVIDADTEQILGCAILSMEGGEIMSLIQVAMMGRLPYTTLRDSPFAHPTLAESLNNLFGTVE